MKLTLCTWLLVAVAAAQESEGYFKNNPLNLGEATVFYSTTGNIYEVYSSEKEIRNIQVPQDECTNVFLVRRGSDLHPSIYFNLYSNGENEGVFVLKNQTAVKIRDGSDSVANYGTSIKATGEDTSLVYISASDGIYTYKPATGVTSKFGNITGNFTAIDKASDKDELYVLATDNKIYKITSQGTVKTKVEGIDYAKDFVLDRLGAIYFIGEDDKPQLLKEGTAVKIPGLNFEVKNAFLSRPPFHLYALTHVDHEVPLTIDGVPYVLKNNTVEAVGGQNIVPGLTALSVECSYINYYGEKGHIYMHSLLALHLSRN